MKIKSIYIKQFGCLKDYKEQFNDGFNKINAQNEFGKTTIAEFIYAMLYGMRKNSRNIRDNTRKRYLPWGEKFMEGEITVSIDDKNYIIRRKFGAKKSDDTVSVIDEVTGESKPRFETDAPMFEMTGVGADAFYKALYINHFYVDMTDGSDEIMDRLVNLTQTGEEDASYNNATEILDKAIKEINGRTGKIKQLNDKLDLLYVNITNAKKDMILEQQLKDRAQSLKQQQQVLTAEMDKKDNKLFSKKLIIVYVILLVLAIALAFVHPVLILLPIIALVFVIIGALKTDDNKTHIDDLMQITQELARCEENIKALQIANTEDIQCEIDYLLEKIEKYKAKLNDLTFAKQCLDNAFSQLQQGFGVELNNNVSEILSVVTDNKYDGVKVSGQYEMVVHSVTDGWQSAEFLSDGAFDQIYFALKMALIKMLFPNMPLILDDAFVRYDEQRLKRAMEYLTNTDNQIIMFSCKEVM